MVDKYVVVVRKVVSVSKEIELTAKSREQAEFAALVMARRMEFPKGHPDYEVDDIYLKEGSDA